MDVNRPNRDELEYELSVRGFNNTRVLTVDQMRKRLRDDMREETLGELVEHEGFNPDIETEITVCNNKIVHLDDYLSSRNISRNSNEHRYLNTKLQHLYSRLSRLKTGEAEINLKNSIKNLNEQLMEIERNLDNKLFENEGISVTSTAASGDRATLPALSNNDNASKCYVPVHKWGIYFSGEPNDRNGLGVNAFIERVEEYRVSRGVSDEELKNSITDLLKGGALIWYRLIKSNVRSWAHFVELLKDEYLPFTFERDLKEEIRNSVQDSRERVGSYFARMINIFNRLPHPLPEIEMLEILRQNIDTYYIHGLGSTLYSIRTVDNLLKECKELEKVRNLAHNRPTTKRIHLLEQDLAGPSGDSKQPRRGSAGNLSSIVCWNCDGEGHSFSKCKKRRENKFCFRCGRRDVTKYTCGCKSGNGQRDRRDTGRRSPVQNR